MNESEDGFYTNQKKTVQGPQSKWGDRGGGRNMCSYPSQNNTHREPFSP